MSTTPRDLITASLQKLGVLASSESLGASEAKDGLAALNRMLDSWSTQELLVYAITQENPITLVGGQAAYTLGAGGTLTTRPMEIVQALVRSNNVDYPVRVISLTEYVAIPNKSVTSNFPDSLYDDGGYPQRTISLFPVPSVSNSLILFTLRPLSSLTTLDTAVSLPPGYEEAIIYNLAVRLSADYGKQVSEAVLALAVDTKADIKRANYKPKVLHCDNALVGRGHFNILTGGFTR